MIKKLQQTRNGGGIPPSDKVYLQKQQIFLCECGKTNDDYLDSRQHCLMIAFLVLAWSGSKTPAKIVLMSSDNPETSSWFEHKCTRRSPTSCFMWHCHQDCTLDAWLLQPCRNGLVKELQTGEEAVCWTRTEALRIRPCGRKLAVQFRLGASWKPEPAASFMQKNSRDLEMKFLKVRKQQAVESELQNQLEQEPLAISTRQQSSKKKLTKENRENFFLNEGTQK